MSNPREDVEFWSGKLRLEGRLCRPGGKGAGNRAGLVICHPHPLFGGSMENNIVVALEDEGGARGFMTLAFNFRGMGRSQGEYDHMRGEPDDVIAALHFLAGQPGVARDRLALSGYSFGGLMALYAAADLATREPENGNPLAVAALALVSPMPPPEGWQKDPRLGLYLKNLPPAFIVTGTYDRICPVEAAQTLAGLLKPDTQLRIEKDTDHFWWDREDRAGKPAMEFLAARLEP